jgi:sarcosine oxidase/L-pipecolate oxidase
MSVTEDGTIKFNLDMCFTNDQKRTPCGPTMSLTPTEPEHLAWTEEKFPQIFKDKALRTIVGIYGESAKSAKIESYRMCWYLIALRKLPLLIKFRRDASTPRHDFLICPHPHFESLYVATGGSFHGYKFLPVIGDYIVNMMKGTLDDELKKRWAWDVDGSKPDHMANPTYKVIGNLEDFLDQVNGKN